MHIDFKQILAKHGPLAVLCLALALFMMTVMRSDAQELQSTMDDHNEKEADFRVLMGAFMVQQAERSKDNGRLLLGICLNSAETEAQRDRCLE